MYAARVSHRRHGRHVRARPSDHSECNQLVLRSLLPFLLVACGSRDPAPPNKEPPVVATPPVQLDEPKPTCKAGEAVCDGDDVLMCEDGHRMRKVAACRGGCKQGACVDTCGANDVELIYLVDGDRQLLSFDPRKLPRDPFRAIGALDCESRVGPNSMAVDRTGIAWVGYNDGVLHQASLLDAHCFHEASRPEGAPELKFGMGFVSDGPKATTEKLYVVEYGGTELATIDTSVFPTRWVPQGKLPVQREFPPELTGTGEGRLYGYFPDTNNRGFIQEIDRKGKLIGRRWDLPRKTGQVGGWAFAFWGDVFYVFVTVDDANEVHAVHRKTGKHQLVIENGPHRIVGAGVSTCAPLLEKPN